MTRKDSDCFKLIAIYSKTRRFGNSRANHITSPHFLGECETNGTVEFNTWLQEDLKHQVSGQWTMPGTTRTTFGLHHGPINVKMKRVFHFLAKRWAEAHQSFENNQPAKMVDFEQG